MVIPIIYLFNVLELFKTEKIKISKRKKPEKKVEKKKKL
jgi:hypothetical protein